VARERALAEVSNWTMDVRRVVADEQAIAAELVRDIQFIKNTPPDFFLGPQKAGQQIHLHFVALYTLRDGKTSELRFFLSPVRPREFSRVTSALKWPKTGSRAH
jgi:predicted ester cyclase